MKKYTKKPQVVIETLQLSCLCKTSIDLYKSDKEAEPDGRVYAKSYNNDIEDEEEEFIMNQLWEENNVQHQ